MCTITSFSESNSRTCLKYLNMRTLMNPTRQARQPANQNNNMEPHWSWHTDRNILSEQVLWKFRNATVLSAVNATMLHHWLSQTRSSETTVELVRWWILGISSYCACLLVLVIDALIPMLTPSFVVSGCLFNRQSSSTLYVISNLCGFLFCWELLNICSKHQISIVKRRGFSFCPHNLSCLNESIPQKVCFRKVLVEHNC